MSSDQLPWSSLPTFHGAKRQSPCPLLSLPHSKGLCTPKPLSKIKVVVTQSSLHSSHGLRRSKLPRWPSPEDCHDVVGTPRQPRPRRDLGTRSSGCNRSWLLAGRRVFGFLGRFVLGKSVGNVKWNEPSDHSISHSLPIAPASCSCDASSFEFPKPKPRTLSRMLPYASALRPGRGTSITLQSHYFKNLNFITIHIIATLPVKDDCLHVRTS